MSSNNNATKAFFKSGYGIVLAVYDTRRGQQEGREAEKVLSFYPPTAPGNMQSSIVGLAQALTMFAGTFNKECSFHSMEAHKHLWTMYHAEPDLWLLLVVGRQLVGPQCLQSSLTGLLKNLHSLAALLHGLISTQLEQDPSGIRVRMRLQPLLQEFAASLLQPDSPALFSLSSPLGLTGGVPLLQISAAAFTLLQSLANRILVARLFGCRPVTGVLVCWKRCLLWTSLGSADSAALHALAVRGLEPAVREGAKHKTWRKPVLPAQQLQQPHVSSTTPPLPQSTHSSTSRGSSPATLSPSAAGFMQHSDVMSLASSATWVCRPDGLLLPVHLCASTEPASSTPGGGNGAGKQQACFPCSELPLVWLQSGSEAAQLMAWHSGPLLVVLLLESQGAALTNTAALVDSLQSMLVAPAASLAAQLTAELPPKHMWHVKGLRYLYQDHLAAAVRASPQRKVLTLSNSSVHVATDARQHAALEAAAAADPTAAPLGPLHSCVAAAATGSSMCDVASSQAGSSSTRPRVLGPAWESFAAGGEDADIEVVLKGFNDSWTVCRHTRSGRQLTAVVESDKEGLPGVMRVVQGFCDRECLGVFEGLS